MNLNPSIEAILYRKADAIVAAMESENRRMTQEEHDLINFWTALLNSKYRRPQ